MSRKAPRIQATVKLLNLIDIERGASSRAESAAIAVSVARELPEGMTRAERIAADEFLTDVARAVRRPADDHPVQAPDALGGSRRVEKTPWLAGSHDRDAGTANRDDLLMPAHRPREAEPAPQVLSSQFAGQIWRAPSSPRVLGKLS